MAFRQADFVRQENIGQRDAYTSYNYKTDDGISEIATAGYFFRIPRYTVEYQDVVRIQCADGFYICSFLEDTTSVQVEVSPGGSGGTVNVVETATNYSQTAVDDVIIVTATATITLLDPNSATKVVTVRNIAGTTTIQAAAGTVETTSLTVGQSTTLAPTSTDWYEI